jgi:hypothetical protein
MITSAGKRKPAKAEGIPTPGRRRRCRFIPPLSPISQVYWQRNSAESGNPYPVNGVWVAMLGSDHSPEYYTEVAVIVPPSQHAMATEILNQYLQATRSS